MHGSGSEMYEEGLFHSGRHLARIALSMAALLIAGGHAAFALTNVTLAWDPSSDPLVTGYRVYYGTITGTYTNTVDAGATNSATVPALKEGTRYYFAATALDVLGQESAFSSETNYVPGGNQPPVISSIADQFTGMDTATPALAFTVSDAETPPSSLVVSAASDNSSVVSQSGIVMGGSNGNRTVRVTPVSGASGQALITLTVDDGVDTASTSFQVSVSSSRPPPTNNFTPAAASYSGLFYEADQVQFQSAGSFKLATTTKSAYSGQLKHQGKTYSLSGKLDGSGRGSNSIPRKGQSSLVFRFDCGTSNDAGLVFGTLSDTTWVASVSGDRLTFNSRTNPAPWTGSYTLVLPGQEDGSSPSGHSYGTVKVKTSGAVSFAGSLADGTRVSQGAWLSKEGMWPFYVSLYSSKGLVISWLGVSNAPASVADVTGPASWIKLADPLAHFYPGGFTTECNAAGGVYVKPPSSTNHVVHLNKARMAFSGGNLAAAFTNVVDIGLSSKIINDSTNLMTMSFSLSSGTFSGRVLDPVTKKSRSFGGAVLQKFNVGYGMLLGTNLSSQVELSQ